MDRLPLLISVPHAGKDIPEEVKNINLLSHDEITADGDVGADEIYDIADYVDQYVTTSVARAFVDMNRAPTDIRKDGIVKTHTCWDVPIYNEPLNSGVIKTLIENYHKSYHDKLSKEAQGNVILGIDCHTMAEVGPPVGPDKGKKRPLICLSNGDGTCSPEWLASLQGAFGDVFGENININDPFQGGYITRHHSKEVPWVQLEFSRTKSVSNKDKKLGVLKALSSWCSSLK